MEGEGAGGEGGGDVETSHRGNPEYFEEKVYLLSVSK